MIAHHILDSTYIMMVKYFDKFKIYISFLNKPIGFKIKFILKSNTLKRDAQSS